ncbi:MAG: helix-turn-helix domain-containing protein [Hyphomicrobiaceae bacterium TMED74]|nr:hypothetical protein [Filomicrobium sp.]RPG47822.1 MAG: helix-turn-helix domain-containing protein [Hyphomicrobiaceae bacterium TMED74]
MRYPATEKLEIIRLVEGPHLPVKRTLAKIGVSRPTFYRWYDLYRRFGEGGLEDMRAGPKLPAWNRIPDDVRVEILDMALDKPDLSPSELALTFADERQYFVSEASVYRTLKAHNLITSPAHIVLKAADEFKDKTTAPSAKYLSQMNKQFVCCCFLVNPDWLQDVGNCSFVDAVYSFVVDWLAVV